MSRWANTVSADGAEEINSHNSDTATCWEHAGRTRHKRIGHLLHPNLNPNILTCVLPLGTIRPEERARMTPRTSSSQQSCYAQHFSRMHPASSKLRSLGVPLSDRNQTNKIECDIFENRRMECVHPGRHLWVRWTTA